MGGNCRPPETTHDCHQFVTTTRGAELVAVVRQREGRTVDFDPRDFDDPRDEARKDRNRSRDDDHEPAHAARGGGASCRDRDRADDQALGNRQSRDRDDDDSRSLGRGGGGV